MFEEINLFVLVMISQANFLVLLMFVQVSPLVVVMLEQVIFLVLAAFVQLKDSNVCLHKPVCTNYVDLSRSICESKACQINPTSNRNIRRRYLVDTSNTLPSRPICTNHVCFVSSSLSNQQISSTFLLSILPFSVYYKYSI